jgi:hypothetical protein
MIDGAGVLMAAVILQLNQLIGQLSGCLCQWNQ